MKKFIGTILFIGILFASSSQTFLQHLRVNGIEDFTIRNHTLTVRQSGPLLKGELLKEAKANGIEKVAYYVGFKDKAGYKIENYKISGDKLVLTKTVYPFKNIRKPSSLSGGYYKVCKTNLSAQDEYYLTVQCNKLALGMVINIKMNPENFGKLGSDFTKAHSYTEAAANMTPKEHQYMQIFNNICVKTRAVFCKNEKPAMVVLKAYLNSLK